MPSIMWHILYIKKLIAMNLQYSALNTLSAFMVILLYLLSIYSL